MLGHRAELQTVLMPYARSRQTGRLAVLIRSGAGPLELGMFSRTLLLAAGVGVVAGLVGSAFVASVDAGTHLILEYISPEPTS